MSLHFPFINEHTIKYLEFIDSRNYIDKKESGENHHIYPTSIFGKNNLTIRLSYADHFKAHWYLVKMYELEGIKRPYMQMAKAFFSFIHCADYRKDLINNYSEEEIESLSVLIGEANEQNRLSSLGELNPFYGKTHSPEQLAKMIGYRGFKWSDEQRTKYKFFCETRDPNEAPRHYFHDPITLENTRVSQNAVNNNTVDPRFIAGKYTPESERLRRSLRMQEVSSTMDYSFVKRGEESHWYGTKHGFNPVTNHRIRVMDLDDLPEGYINSIGMTDDHLRNLKDAAFKRRGIPQPHTALITNKNPEKIRKTAEKHRGMIRGKDARKNISDARLKFFEDGGVASNKGKKRIFNTKTRKVSYVEKTDLDSYVFDGSDYTGQRLFKVSNESGFLYITNSEKLPEGYSYATNSGK